MVAGKMSQITVQLPDSIHKRAEQIAVIEAVDHISRRAARANEQAFLTVLAKVPAGESEEEWDKPTPKSDFSFDLRGEAVGLRNGMFSHETHEETRMRERDCGTLSFPLW